MTLQGKRIVVTGAASGIGKACAGVLKNRGAVVIALDRNRPDEGLIQEYISVDLMDPSSIDAAVDAVTGPIDGLCNIAGVPPTAPVATVITVNFVAQRYLTERMIDKLGAGASIVNMASLAGADWRSSLNETKQFVADATFGNVHDLCATFNIDAERSYFFSKELLRIWTMQNWDTWRDRGIRINSVSPGPIETPILDDFLDTLGERAEEDMDVMGRAGTADEIAGVVAFLCGDESRWVNGANVAADGGMHAHVMRKQYEF